MPNETELVGPSDIMAAIRDEVHLELNVLNGLEIGHKVLSHSPHTVGRQYTRDV